MRYVIILDICKSAAVFQNGHFNIDISRDLKMMELVVVFIPNFYNQFHLV
jgi:hypothetical protein